MSTWNPAALAAFASGDIANTLIASTPGGIERQEAEGQRELVSSTNMPLELEPNKEVFEAAGFKFGEPVDEVFQAAELPAGWKREASEHSMHSHILDEHDRRRVSVFYKAAFYDRRAHARLQTRYSPSSEYPDDRSLPIKRGVSDQALGGKLIFTAGEEARGEYDPELSRALDAAATAWLTTHFPNWSDPLAYW